VASNRYFLMVRVLLLALLITAPAEAAGKGKGGNRGSAASGGSAGPTGTSGASTGVGFRQFGSWLDDASAMTPGDAWTSIAFGHYRSIGGSQTDFPVVDFGIGLSKRTQFGVTVPYYRLHFIDGSNAGGVGDVFLSGKVVLIDPTTGTRSFGVSISPVIEVAQNAAPGYSNMAWAAPVNMEFRGSSYRVYASTGYFSRGALFGSAALEVPLADRLVVSGSLAAMRSVAEDLTADAMGLPKGRTDATISAAFFLSDTMAVFGGTGRTLTGASEGGTSRMISGGVSMTFSGRTTP
jgi:hypothetical protein